MSDYDDDDRPSWRDIDKKRDRSSHVRQEKKEGKGAAKPGADRWQTGKYKEALNQLFKGEKGTIEHEKLYNKIHKTYGTEAFLPTVQKYVEKYGLPDDVSTLILILDTKDAGLMIMTIDKLKEIYPRQSTPRAKEDIRRKLSIIAMTDRSGDVKEVAAEVVEELKKL